MKEALIQYLNDRIDWHKREQSRLKKADCVDEAAHQQISINVYGAQGQDVNQLADIIQAKMNRAVVNQKAVFA